MFEMRWKTNKDSRRVMRGKFYVQIGLQTRLTHVENYEARHSPKRQIPERYAESDEDFAHHRIGSASDSAEIPACRGSPIRVSGQARIMT